MTSDDEQQQLMTQCLPDRIGFLGAGQVRPYQTHVQQPCELIATGLTQAASCQHLACQMQISKLGMFCTGCLIRRHVAAVAMPSSALLRCTADGTGDHQGAAGSRGQRPASHQHQPHHLWASAAGRGRTGGRCGHVAQCSAVVCWAMPWHAFGAGMHMPHRLPQTDQRRCCSQEGCGAPHLACSKQSQSQACMRHHHT
jgi:hypothetical protein